MSAAADDLEDPAARDSVAGVSCFEGDLHKLGGFLQKKWQQRFFRLQLIRDAAQQRPFPALFYFTDRGSLVAKSRIDLVGPISVVPVVASNSGQPPQHPGDAGGDLQGPQHSLAVGPREHCFALSLWRDGNVRRVYYLSADSAEARDAWVEALRTLHRGYLAQVRVARQSELLAQAAAGAGAASVVWPSPAHSILPLLTVDDRFSLEAQLKGKVDQQSLAAVGSTPGHAKLQALAERLAAAGLLQLDPTGERIVLRLAAPPSALPSLLSRQGPDDGWVLTSRRLVLIECSRVAHTVDLRRIGGGPGGPHGDGGSAPAQLYDAYFARRGLMGAANLHLVLQGTPDAVNGKQPLQLQERVVALADAHAAMYLGRLLFDGLCLGLPTLPWVHEESSGKAPAPAGGLAAGLSLSAGKDLATASFNPLDPSAVSSPQHSQQLYFSQAHHLLSSPAAGHPSFQPHAQQPGLLRQNSNSLLRKLAYPQLQLAGIGLAMAGDGNPASASSASSSSKSRLRSSRPQSASAVLDGALASKPVSWEAQLAALRTIIDGASVGPHEDPLLLSHPEADEDEDELDGLLGGGGGRGGVGGGGGLGTGVRIDHLGNVIADSKLNSGGAQQQQLSDSQREALRERRFRRRFAGLPLERLCQLAASEDALHDPVLGYSFERERLGVRRAARRRRWLGSEKARSEPHSSRLAGVWYDDDAWVAEDAAEAAQQQAGGARGNGAGARTGASAAPGGPGGPGAAEDGSLEERSRQLALELAAAFAAEEDAERQELEQRRKQQREEQEKPANQAQHQGRLPHPQQPVHPVQWQQQHAAPPGGDASRFDQPPAGAPRHSADGNQSFGMAYAVTTDEDEQAETDEDDDGPGASGSGQPFNPEVATAGSQPSLHLNQHQHQLQQDEEGEGEDEPGSAQ